MTPEERFERIETQLELVVRYLSHSGDRIDRNAETIAGLSSRMDQLTSRMDQGFAQLGALVDQTSRDVAKLVDAVASLVKLFERHTGDGHGGKK